METKIRVENVDYYSVGPDMNAVPVSSGGLFPKELNGHTEYLEHTIRKLPTCNLNVKIPFSKSFDLKMESLLDYISQKGWASCSKGKPDFVTTKELLKSVASMETNLIHVCRVGSVIYILNADKETPDNYAKIFNHFMTKKQNDNGVVDDGPLRKGVFKATILKGEKESDSWNILYSGNVDAVKRTQKGNLRHYELKVTNGPVGADYLWSENSCSDFWRSFFSGSATLIVGSRTDKTVFQKSHQLKYPKFSVYEIKEIARDSIPSNVSELPWRFQWTVSDGKRNIRDLLQLIKNHLKSDGDCFVFSRNPGNWKWDIRKDEKTVAEFRDEVRRTITV